MIIERYAKLFFPLLLIWFHTKTSGEANLQIKELPLIARVYVWIFMPILIINYLVNTENLTNEQAI